MKWMKQAARNLVAMAAALCLLLPCAVPASAESLQTPVWMQAWGGTRTAGVVGQLEQDRFTATIRVGEMNGTVELVRDNGKMYWKAEKLDGTEVLVNLGHRVIETDGNAASADDEVPALSQAADGSYFIGQVIRAVGYVIEGDGCAVLFQ